MAIVSYLWKTLALLIGMSFLLSYAGVAQEGLDPNRFPAEWQVREVDFSLLEPAAGTIAQISPSRVTPTAAGLMAPRSFRIDELSRTTDIPPHAAVFALPQPATVSASAAEAEMLPLSQALPGVGARGVAADLGIVVNEQPIAGPQVGVPGLAAYGPLSGAAADGLWLRAPQSIQQGRLQAATRQGVASPALRERWRQILLASVAAPQAAEGAPHWLAVRAEMLEKLGMYEASWSLWREAKGVLSQPNVPTELMQGWARASLLAGQTEEGCALVRAQAAQGMVSDFWPAAAAVCAAVEAAAADNPTVDDAALGLAIQLLPPSMMKSDPALLAALNAVRDGAAPRLGNWPVGSLAGATVAVVPELLSPSQLAGLPDVVLRRLYATPALDPAFRLQAIQNLVGRTASSADANLWLTMISSPTLPEAPAANWPDSAVVAWAKGYVQAEVGSPSSTPAVESSARVVAAALRLGDTTTALGWWGPYRAATGLSPVQLRARWQTYMALQLAQGQNVSGTLASWLPVRGADTLANRRVLAVVAGMGQPVPATLWAQLAEDAPEQTDTLNLAWQNLVKDAAEQQDIPAVMAMVSEALRGQNAASASPAVLQSALAGLRQVGLHETAQRLAAEALTLSESQTLRVLKMADPALPMAATPTVPMPRVPSVTAPKPPLLPKPKV